MAKDENEVSDEAIHPTWDALSKFGLRALNFSIVLFDNHIEKPIWLLKCARRFFSDTYVHGNTLYDLRRQFGDGNGAISWLGQS